MLVRTWQRRLPPPGGPGAAGRVRVPRRSLPLGARAGARAPRRRPSKTPVRTVLSPWARDALGIGLIVLSLLAALSLWLEAGGPVGRGIAWLTQGMFGVAAYAFPVLGAWWGFVLLRDVAREDRVRMAIGFGVLVAGVLGLISLFAGNPSITEGWTGDLSDAGGAIGALAAWPLARVISPIGAAIVCAGLASLGLLIFTGTPFAAVKEKIATFREERDERDPVSAKAKDAEREKPRRRWSLREAFGLTDDVIQLPEVGDEQDASTETIAAVAEDPEFPSEPTLPAASGSRSRTVKTPFGPVPAPAARPVPHRAAVKRRLSRGTGHAGRPRADPPHVRRRRPGRGRAPRAHRHDVRGRCRIRHEGEQGAGSLERHLLRAGDTGRSHPGADPRQVGDRDRGPEHAPRLRDGRRRPALSGGEAGRPTRWRSPSGRTSTAARGW